MTGADGDQPKPVQKSSKPRGVLEAAPDSDAGLSTPGASLTGEDSAL